jgi:hypothetical protein
MLSKFFKWLYYPNEDFRKRLIPNCMQGIRKLPRKEKTSYKPSDIWEVREHAMSLKYCPYKRDNCYYALARDMSARPHEILNLKLIYKKCVIGAMGSWCWVYLTCGNHFFSLSF